MRKILPRTACAISALMSISGCITDRQSNRGSVVDNELRVGVLYLADGSPAVQARVRVFPVDHVPDTSAASNGSSAIFSTRTDAKGRYQVDSLPEGEYNIVGEYEGISSYQDSVMIQASTDSIPADTLDKPASLSGIVELQPQDDPRTVVVQVMGTNSYANVGLDGRFTLSYLAGGRYTIRVVTTASEYTPLLTTFRVTPRETAAFPDTLRLIYTGIPVVTGLKAVYDTALGVVRLSWHPVEYRNFSDYLVFRDLSPTSNPSENSLAVLHDTVFVDSLAGGTAPLFTAGGPQSLALEYRVRVLSKTDKKGLAFGKASLTVGNPNLVKTTLAIKVLGGKGDSARAGDTLRIEASFRNPTRKVDTMEWYADRSLPAIRIAKVSAASGTDVLAYSWEAVSRPWIYVLAKDDGGGARWDSLRIDIVADEPIAFAGADTLVTVKSSLRLSASATVRFGSIVKWEWDIGNTGNFREAKDTTFTTPAGADTNFLCILRVTTDQGQSDQDTLRVTVMPWVRLADAPFNGVGGPYDWGANGFPQAVVNGKLYAFVQKTGGFSRIAGSLTLQAVEFDPETSRWTEKAMAPDPGLGVIMHLVRVIDGIVYLPNPENLFAYNTQTDKWLIKAPPPTLRTNHAGMGIPSVVLDGKLYLVGGKERDQNREGKSTNHLDAYDPVTDTWKAAAPIPVPMKSAYDPNYLNEYAVYPIGDKLLLYYNPISQQWPEDRLITFLYDPGSDSWTPGDSSLQNTGGTPAPDGLMDGKVYAGKGKYNYDIATGKWSKTNLPAGGFPYTNELMLRKEKLFFFFNQPFSETPGGKPQPPWRTAIKSFDPSTAHWDTFHNVTTDVSGLTPIQIGNRVFMVTGQYDAPMQIFEYFLP